MKLHLFIILITLISCQLEDSAPTDGAATFYIVPDTFNNTWTILVDGIHSGFLDETNTVPACQDNSYFKIYSSVGPHHYVIKSSDGVEVIREFEIRGWCDIVQVIR